MAAEDAASKTVLIGVPNNVFARLNEGHPGGVMLEATVDVLAKMGFRATFITIPASDIPKALEMGQIDVAAVRIQSPRSKESALFSDPIIHEYNVPITRAGERLPFRKLSDLSGKIIAGRTGFHYPSLSSSDKGDITIRRFESDGAMIRSLLLREVDVAIIAALSDIYVFRSEGVMRHIEVLDVSIGSVPLRAAFNSRKFSNSDLQRFNQLLNSYQSSAAWQVLLERNGIADLVREWTMLSD
jgi:hypothetical protein